MHRDPRRYYRTLGDVAALRNGRAGEVAGFVWQAMRPQVAKVLLSLAGVDFRSPKARAIDFVLELRPLAYAQVPPWWQWTVAIALAITCKRIEAA